MKAVKIPLPLIGIIIVSGIVAALSEPVRASLDEGVRLVEELLDQLIASTTNERTSP